MAQKIRTHFKYSFNVGYMLPLPSTTQRVCANTSANTLPFPKNISYFPLFATYI